ncbi:hypothetical protein NPIL_528281 [Nephila pilipes]|uniref:Uncharacterized protein n=1 Tax=Nephila pilipes TaxID=299642 RepID=A0A8X6R4R1_NEPPI|nr:hypothetical protein NPIL_528281 [Nephila pilipes]
MTESNIIITPSKINIDAIEDSGTYSMTSLEYTSVTSPESSPASPPYTPSFTLPRRYHPVLSEYKPESVIKIYYFGNYVKTIEETKDLGEPEKIVYKCGNRKFTFILKNTLFSD